MPGNTIMINNAKELEWYVGDSKMDLLIDFLDVIGHRMKRIEEEEKRSKEMEVR